ncbi:MAG: bifunctional isocitrate dehydrogenase kinase/phosphatase [Sandaracinaceae bacterium]
MTSRPPTPSRLAAPVAQAILEAFQEQRAGFLEITRRARESFEARDWVRFRADSKKRLGLYRQHVDKAEMRVRVLLGERARDRLVWVSAKAVYSALIAMRQDWDVAETFFNGVTRRLFDTVGVDPLVEFVASDFDAPPSEPEHRVYRRFAGSDVADLVCRAIASNVFALPFVDLEADAALVAERAAVKLADIDRGQPVAYEVLEAPFFHGKGAYLVGRLVLPAGAVLPLVLALRNGPEGIFVDAALTESDDVSILFSFTRSYFHVDAERPYDVMRFLRSLIPKKRIAEIYIAIGEPKQGKTELYRAIMDHIDESRDTFGFAPGTPGLVMVVFTMPGMDVVVKVIRDEFPPEKQSTSTAHVRDRYNWVYEHDRAGRLVDAQEFEFLAFPKARFEPALLEELLEECGKTVRVDGDRVVIDRCYVSRQLVPLNLYIRQREQAEAQAALAEWGNSIRDMAACNIFPGDLLLKNFGVTRHGRVALYDYDELQPLTDMTFRDVPEARYAEDELRAEPWYAVGAHDVFPEEFPRFLAVPGRLKEGLARDCADIFDASWWRKVQGRVERGKIVELVPYDEKRRLRSDPAADD